MIYMKTKYTILTICLLFIAAFTSAQKKYTYETVPNDPMNARIYTLENGLKVYMTIYKDEPRIQTAIAVRTGSKNDPSDNTGLSHYLEHMMFKGTENFGTLDFKKEKYYLNEIDSLFEVYRGITDTVMRKYQYHKIDSISGIAAKWAIANEYDKMLAIIGAKGTNAYTSVEQTVYINDIPSNQIVNWLTIESDRFQKPAFRIFHTELEAVYEEKNMSLDRDEDKMWEALYAGVFKKHTYGTQTTIGTIEHLKNPSLVSLKKYFYERYVPNNMAICLSGDFDPDKMIALIDEKFGEMKKKNITPFIPPVEDQIKKPIVKEVYGPDAEQVMMAFRFPGANTRDADLLTITNMILSNSSAGLIDLNLNQAQKVLAAGTFLDVMKDYSVHIFYGNPKQGQKPEDVKELLLSQIEEIKKGNFPEWLIPAIINDYKLSRIKMLENNMSRNFEMVDAFVKDIPWSDQVNVIDRLSKITKQDIIEFVKANYNENYVVVYKRTGEDKNVVKVTKPKITPVEVNRNEQSQFLKDIMAYKTEEINPVFLDYNKDIVKAGLKSNITLLYKQNTENKRFDLYYYYKMGSNNDKKLDLAVKYLKYLGTSIFKPSEVQQEFYKMGCNFGVYSSDDQIWVYLSGLSENMERGLMLFENLLTDAQPNKEALKNLVEDIIKQRDDDKLSNDVILWSAMYNYGEYGAKSPFTNILAKKELEQINADELITIIKGLNSFEHQVLYYGPETKDAVVTVLNKYHNAPDKLKPVPAETKFEQQPNNENKIFVVDFDMKQVEILMLSKSEKFNKDNAPVRRLFNEYFGGGMSSIVFQELRESKALAYSAYAGYRSPSKPDECHYIMSYIGTQNDKLPEAMKGMFELLNNMPESDKSLNAAKEAILKQIRTERITKSDVLFNYLNSEKMGIDHDMRMDIYKQIPFMTMSDLKNFQSKLIKNQKYFILVLGKKDKLDASTLKKYGKVEYLDLKTIFGY